MVQHVHDRGEVKVLHSALAPLGQRQAQVLRGEKPVGSGTGPAGLEAGRGTAPPTSRRTLAMPWKLNVSTYSPRRVSLCRTRNTPWAAGPCSWTSCAAFTREMGPWNQG